MGTTRKVSKAFPKEHPEKPWTTRKKYKKWVRKLTRKGANPRRTKEEDLCVGKRSICKGDLGIPRKYMPQFLTTADVGVFRKFIRRVYHINSHRTTA